MENRNKLLTYKKVLKIVNDHYEEGVTTYAGVWRLHVYPVYPMSYNTFLRIINKPDVESSLRRCPTPAKSSRLNCFQLSLF